MNSNLVFYRGVVEDNNDPEKLGRLRVRIFGIHSDNIEELPTEELPWSEVAYSLENGFISGVGKSFVALKGTFVWCFLDSNDTNKPVVFASCVGISHEKESGAFTDPDGKYPLDDRLKESDFNRFARGDKVSEADAEKLFKEKQLKGVSTTGGSTWDEPDSNNSQAQYPFNNVTETQSGHIIQFDDTNGNERIQIFHKSGSYIEIKPDGSIILKSTKDFYQIATENHKQNTGQNYDLTINADKTELITGNSEFTIGKDETKEINGEHDLTIGKSSSISIAQGGLYNCGTDLKLKAGTNATLEGNVMTSVKGLTTEIKGTTAVNIDGGALVAIKGGILKLN